MNKIGTIIVALAVIANPFASAHTWVSCVNQQGNNCNAYIRNYVGRSTPTAAVDDYYTWKALGRPNDFPLCKPDSQSSNRTYTSQYPMATAKAGDTLNIMYTPNGHSNPGDRGLQTTSRIHWTGNPSTQLNTRADLNSGNQLTSWPYGQNCATTGDVASLPCVNGFTIPAGTPTGVYQFVWYWPYDKDQQQSPIGEEYFSCFDVAVTGTAYVAPTTSVQATPSSTTSNANPSSTTTSNAATSNNANPTSASPSGTGSDVCASSLANCQSFCAPAAATQCDCDPVTGKKTVRCAGAEDSASSASSIVVGSSMILAMAAIAQAL